MSDIDQKIKEVWAEYAHAILDKTKELHAESKETRKSIEDIKLALARLEANKEDVKTLKDWKKEVSDVWSPANMAKAHVEIYKQKTKWSILYGVLIAIQIIWGLILAYWKK